MGFLNDFLRLVNLQSSCRQAHLSSTCPMPISVPGPFGKPTF